MIPSPNRQAVYVGLFVTAATTILTGGVLMVGDLNDTFTRKISVMAVFDEVNGLQKGDNIWYSGMKVGTVKGLCFEGASQVQVELKIDTSATPFIHQDVLAKIGTDGLIGNRIVILYGGTLTTPTLQEGDSVAVGKMVSTEEIMTTLQQNNQNMLAITDNLKEISLGLVAGQGTLGQLLQDEVLYVTLIDTASTLQVTTSNLREVSHSLQAFSSDINRSGSLPHQIVTDRTTYPSLVATVGDVQHAGERAALLLDGLTAGASDTKTPFGTLMYDQSAGTDLKMTLDQLNGSSQLLAEDMVALRHNILFRRYFRKQARAAKQAGSVSTGLPDLPSSQP